MCPQLLRLHRFSHIIRLFKQQLPYLTHPCKSGNTYQVNKVCVQIHTAVETRSSVLGRGSCRLSASHETVVVTHVVHKYDVFQNWTSWHLSAAEKAYCSPESPRDPVLFLFLRAFCPSFGFSLCFLPPHLLVNSTCALDGTCAADPRTVLFVAEAVIHDQ